MIFGEKRPGHFERIRERLAAATEQRQPAADVAPEGENELREKLVELARKSRDLQAEFAHVELAIAQELTQLENERRSVEERLAALDALA